MNFRTRDRARVPGRKGFGGDWKFLFGELFVALSLSVAFFFMVRNYFDYGNPMNGNIFMAGSEKLYRLNSPVMGGHWNERLSGLLLTGSLMDYSLGEKGADEARAAHLRNLFGAYHACWLLLIFVCVIFSLRNSMFINFGIFAGLMYDFSPASGPYFFPWDVSATFFFTLAALFFERRRIWLMILAILAGAFFDESVLACALFVLFAQWKWPKRILAFMGALVVYMLVKRSLLNALHLEAPMLSINAFFSLHGAFSPSTLASNFLINLHTLLSPTLNSVIFANGGTIVAVLVLCWRKRFLPYMVVILAFLAGIFVIAPPPPGISEVRAFMEILPLSVMLLSELWIAQTRPEAAGDPSAGPTIALSTRQTYPLLLPIAIAVVAVSTSIAALQYYIIYEDLQPDNQAQSQLGKYVYQGGPPANLDALSEWFRNGYLDAQLKLAVMSQRDHLDGRAIAGYEDVLAVDTNSVYALNNLATLLATDSDARLRNGDRAVNLAGRACRLTQYKDAALIYTLAAAYAEAGRFKEAVATGERAKSVALAHGEQQMVSDNEPLLELYKTGHPFHLQPAPANP